MTTALIVLVLALVALVALTAALTWDEYRDYPPTPRRINGDTQGDSR